MAYTKKLDFGGRAFKDVLGFTVAHWGKQPWRIVAIVALALLSALADVLTPLYAGRLVDALAAGAAGKELAWRAGTTAFSILACLGLAGTLLSQLVFMNIIVLTLKMMSKIAANAFHRVPRFSAAWPSKTFAGSAVRRITHAMWALHLVSDTLLIAVHPSLVMLVGATVLLGIHCSIMDVFVCG